MRNLPSIRIILSIFFLLTSNLFANEMPPSGMPPSGMPPSGIPQSDKIEVKWKQVKVAAPPLNFSLVLFICGIENYRCHKIAQSNQITLPHTGEVNLSQSIFVSGYHINDVIENALDKKSENYQIAVHLYQHPQSGFKNLIGIKDVPYRDLETEVYQQYKVSEPFEASFDPLKFVNTTFEITKFENQPIEEPPSQPVDPTPEPIPTGGLTLEAYDNIIQSVEDIYLPLVSQLSFRLKFVRLWESSEENAIAGMEEDSQGKIYKMTFPGGLARHPNMSAEAYTLVVCHELSHHLGGAPTFPDGASVEGQADYFAAFDCLRRVLIRKIQTESSRQKVQVPVLVKFLCSKAFKDEENRYLCESIAFHGYKTTSFFAQKKNLPVPAFTTPSLTRATKYFEVGEDPHPSAQCRLDTYLAAALCNKHPLSKEVEDNSLAGFINRVPLDEVEVCPNEEYYTLGERPICWFIP